MAVICKFCGGPHPWFECHKKPDGWKPPKEGLASPALESDPVQANTKDAVKTSGAVPRGRPRNGFDKKAYDRKKAAERRAALKEGK